jgi:hypothetical protein
VGDDSSTVVFYILKKKKQQKENIYLQMLVDNISTSHMLQFDITTYSRKICILILSHVELK